MSSAKSVTYWIRELQAGNHQGAQKLWEGYFHRLVKLARTKLKNRPWGVADEEDVALCAFDSFCRGAKRGRFPKLSDRDDLWQLLVMITGRKVADLVEQECRQKRGGGNAQVNVDLEQVVGSDPTPAFAAQVADECRHLFALLEDADLRSIALWKMEGYTNAEIARKLGYVTVTIERRLRLIRKIWQEGKGNDQPTSPRR
jgi:DNA-directed RNA polymerase specialized sigma24 family protein